MMAMLMFVGGLALLYVIAFRYFVMEARRHGGSWVSAYLVATAMLAVWSLVPLVTVIVVRNLKLWMGV